MADTAEPADTERAAARHYLLSFEPDTRSDRVHRWIRLVIEALLTTILVSIILNTATGHRSIGHKAAIAVGSTVALLGLFASPISGASMNPARSLGPDIVSTDFTGWWVYVLGPLIGACIAVIIIGLVRGLPSRPEQAAVEGGELPMQDEAN